MLEVEARARQGARTDLAPNISQKFDRSEPVHRSTEQAAKAVGTYRQYVSDVKKIKAIEPEKFKQIKTGEKTLRQRIA